MELDALLSLLYGQVEIGLAYALHLLVTDGVEVEYLQKVVFLGFFLGLIALLVSLVTVKVDVVTGYHGLIGTGGCGVA